MTGYGKAEKTLAKRKITVEVRSLNSKQMDITVRMPSMYRQWEYEIRQMAARSLGRGKVELFVTVENLTATSDLRINRELFADYYAQLHELRDQTNSEWGSDAALLSIMRMPDVVRNEAAQVPDEEATALMETVGAALTAINDFRQTEGAVLITDILERIDIISGLRIAVEPFENDRAGVIKTRIREAIEGLRLTVDENRLEQEMIYYIEKIDITEEKVRLDNHLKYFRQVAETEQEPGRKLGFISQEIGREINTLGSKANDSDMQRLVVEMKDQLERIKEQVLNVL